jgi:UPF0042 nucleotide-binding protein
MSEGDLSSPLTPAAVAEPAERGKTRLLLVTGMSGAGKTTALKALQDLGYESIDHLPLALLDKLVPGDEVEPASAERLLAVGINVRTRDFTVEALMAAVKRLDEQPNLDVKVLFLSCDDDELCRRYQENRHRHPLAIDRPLFDGIATERQMIEPLRARADLTIDTTLISPGALKRRLERTFGGAARSGLIVLVVSFSYASGVPRDADLVFDVRFLVNPHYQPALRPLTGKDDPVADFIAAEPAFTPFFSSLTTLLEPLLPRYAAEGKTYLTIGVGCTGGRHRSVFVAERLAAWLMSRGQHVLIEHRGLDRLVE